MDALYYFVLATVIATFGIGFVVRDALKKIADNLEGRGQIQTKMFLYTAIIETAPIILIVFGFLYMHETSVDIIIPSIIVIGSTLFNLISLFVVKGNLVKRQNTTKELKSALSTLVGIGCALVMSFPIVSFVAILMASTM